jgi:N-acetylglutamate synthase-like GNAT family acetyltransferase
MKNVKIVEYEEQYKNSFIRISYEWLKKYSLLEPEDILILNHPEEIVQENEGHILFAKYDEKVVGTVALMKIDGDTFELAKLAVAEQYQGLKIGSMLIERCIEIAKKEEAKKIIL